MLLRVLALTVSMALVPAAVARAAAGDGSVGPAAGAGRIVAYRPPVPGRVVRPFDPPATQYGPGHRGVDLAARSGAPVRAAAAGLVRFAGPVAGRGVVVLVHADGIVTEYEPVRPLVRRGARVGAGAVIAVVSGRHAGCVGSCLHWGARRAGAYVDPLGLLEPLGPVVLLPWRGRTCQARG